MNFNESFHTEVSEVEFRLFSSVGPLRTRFYAAFTSACSSTLARRPGSNLGASQRSKARYRQSQTLLLICISVTEKHAVDEIR